MSVRKIDRADKIQRDFFNDLERKLSGKAKSSVGKVKRAASSYIEARVAWKQYSQEWAGSGANSRYASAFSDETSGIAVAGMRLIDALTDVQTSAETLKAADKRLNEIYLQCRNFLKGTGAGPDGNKRQTPAADKAMALFLDWERKWIIYRDTWSELGVAYAKDKKLPKIDPAQLRNGIAVYFTEEQTKNLENACGNDGD
jgi:hypothetical protein